MDAPILQTPRIILRPHTPGDFEASLALWNDPAVFGPITGKASTEQQVWGRLLNYRGLWQLLGYGYWAAIAKESGEYVGELGLADFRRDLQPSIRGIPELGFALASRFHGQGLATEAARAITAWADANLEATHTVCLVDVTNTASSRVAHKLGYAEYARADYNGKSVVLLQRMRAARP